MESILDFILFYNALYSKLFVNQYFDVKMNGDYIFTFCNL